MSQDTFIQSVVAQIDIEAPDEDQMAEALKEWTYEGYEGAIVRDPHGPYKHGRSTMKQGWMLKLKHFDDDEAVILDTEELMHNDDTSTRKKENLVPGNTLGALVVQWKGEEFKIGTGFDASTRAELWAKRDALIGGFVKFKYQGTSSYGVPRFPVFLGLRDERDM